MARLGHARHTTFATIISLAAALLIPVALMSAWVHAESLPQQVYSTAVGEIRPIVLDERISLRMNTGTGATVTQRDELCEVGLDHGEALLQVERESPRPLRVVVGSTVMSARAAKFSVRVRDLKNMDLLVSKGQVTVGTALVGERQMAKISPDGIRLRELNEADVARRLDWVNGHLTFTGETLAEAIAEFNRYNDRKLVIADHSISLIPIGGQFRVSDVSSFVAALRPLGVRVGATDKNSIRLVGAKGAKSPPSFSRRSLMRRALLLLAGTVAVSHAQASRVDKLAFKISAGAAPDALAEFVRQSGLQVLFDFDAIRNFNTHEVSGQLNPTEALSLMLEGSGLTFEFINERTITVRPRPPVPVPVAQPELAS